MNTAAENAIHEWVRLASGLPADHVLWEGRHPYPSGTWILMRVTGSRDFGAPWVDRKATAGDNVEYTARGLREARLELQCIAGDEGGEASCVALLEDVIGKRLLPSHRTALSAAGVGLGAVAPVRWIPAGREALFEPRALVEIAVNLASEASETGPAIKHVEVEGTVDGNVITFWTPDAPPP